MYADVFLFYFSYYKYRALFTIKNKINWWKNYVCVYVYICREWLDTDLQCVRAIHIMCIILMLFGALTALDRFLTISGQKSKNIVLTKARALLYYVIYSRLIPDSLPLYTNYCYGRHSRFLKKWIPLANVTHFTFN